MIICILDILCAIFNAVTAGILLERDNYYQAGFYAFLAFGWGAVTVYNFLHLA